MKILNMSLHKLNLSEKAENIEIIEPTIEEKSSLFIDFNKMTNDEYRAEVLINIAKVINKYKEDVDAVYIAGAIAAGMAVAIISEIYGLKPVCGIINNKKEIISVYPLYTYSGLDRKLRMEIEHL